MRTLHSSLIDCAAALYPDAIIVDRSMIPVVPIATQPVQRVDWPILLPLSAPIDDRVTGFTPPPPHRFVALYTFSESASCSYLAKAEGVGL